MAVNCWQYAREVYLVGRSVKFRAFTAKERTAIIEFINKMVGTRPAYAGLINLKAGNPPVGQYVGEGEERKLELSGLEKQNDYSLGRMIQKIGRLLKVQFCTEEEKEFCDALFAATDGRRNQSYNNYVTDAEEEVAETTVEEESPVEEESSVEGEESSEEESQEEI